MTDIPGGMPVPEALASALSAIGAGWAGAFAEQGFEDLAAVVALAREGGGGA